MSHSVHASAPDGTSVGVAVIGGAVGKNVGVGLVGAWVGVAATHTSASRRRTPSCSTECARRVTWVPLDYPKSTLHLR